MRCLQELAGIQTIVLDNESEFGSLREAVDVLLVGAGGELPADPRHAALLARRLLEYKVSAVVDLCELKISERRSCRAGTHCVAAEMEQRLSPMSSSPESLVPGAS